MSSELLDPISSGSRNLSSAAADTFSYGGAVAQVKTSYCTAVAVLKPRDITAVDKKLAEESNLAGEAFYYGWGAGKDRIEGASVGLALAAARCWGNCAVETPPVQETADAWIFTAQFVDLETGFTLSRQFRQSKRSKVAGKHDEERKDDIRFQIGQSKAVRNVCLNALPRWMIDRALEKAQEGVRAKIEDYIKRNGVAAAQEYATKALAKYGVKPEHVAAKFSIASHTALDIDMLVILRGDVAALQAGQERAEALFPAMAPPPAEKPAGSKSDALANRLGGDEQPETPQNALSEGTRLIEAMRNAPSAAGFANAWKACQQYSGWTDAESQLADSVYEERGNYWAGVEATAKRKAEQGSLIDKGSPEYE